MKHRYSISKEKITKVLVIREYAELVWEFEGSVTATHGFIPRELEVDFTKREIGDNEYKLMCKIKDSLDPNHIMNPKVRFDF